MQNPYDEVAVFASQSFPVGVTNSPDQVNAGYRGINLYLSITNVNGTGTLLLALQGKDPIEGVYYTVFVDAFAITAVGTYVFEIALGVTPIASTSGTVPGTGAIRTAAARLLPKIWRLVVTAASAAVVAQVDGIYTN